MNEKIKSSLTLTLSNSAHSQLLNHKQPWLKQRGSRQCDVVDRGEKVP